ncbi:MAG TPA: FAD-dependent monooxygenase [Gemmatimonadaceae bacterium]|nr:FAD-dependent monooxygenase [Gemmatimonadaceae bacterium]
MRSSIAQGMEDEMAHAERILIVGGGIGGLSVAAALHASGFAPELIERSDAWRAVGAGIAMQPNGMRVLRTLGLGTAVERAGTAIRYWDFCDEQGDILAETDLTALWSDVGPFVGIARRELQRALLAATAAIPSRLGTSVKSLTQDDGGVWVELTDGSAATYDLVIGADGVGSSVRQLAFDAAPPVYGEQMVWRSVAPVRPRGLTNLQFLLGDGCFFGLCPVGSDQTYGFGNVAGPLVRDPPEGRLDRLRERFAGFGDIVHEYLGALDSAAEIHCSAIEWLGEEHWCTGRVVLIGDAAHASSPMMGQGGALAIEDAGVLAESLRAADSVEEALDAFVVRRRPRVRWVREQSRIAGESLRMPVTARNALLRVRGDEMMRQRFAPLLEAP